jgi:hypothetical protein
MASADGAPRVKAGPGHGRTLADAVTATATLNACATCSAAARPSHAGLASGRPHAGRRHALPLHSIARVPNGGRQHPPVSPCGSSAVTCTSGLQRSKPAVRLKRGQTAIGRINSGPAARFEFTAGSTRQGAAKTPGAEGRIRSAAPWPASPSQSGQSACSSVTGSR